MFKKKISKIAFILACIITLIMPYTSTVLAATLTHEDTKVDLQVLSMHKGGEESSNTLTELQEQLYDKNPYGYTVGTTRVYKIIVKGDYDYSNNFYCLNATKSFPGVTSAGMNSLEYTNVGNLKDATNPNVKALHLSSEYSQNENLWTTNYKALLWLADNIFLSTQTPEQKDEYLSKAFEGYDGSDLDTVKALLTDDDIDVVQQFAIWYFTNNDTDKFNVDTLPSVTLSKIDPASPTPENKSYNDLGSEYAERQNMADYLFKYLVKSAKAGVTSDVTYPSMGEISEGNPIEKEGYYYVGPFKVNQGTANSTQYSLKLVDQNNEEIEKENYKIYIDGEEDFTDKNLDEIFNEQYYIYIPETNETITKVKLELTYTTYETKASLWINPTTGEDDNQVYQPVTLLTREKTPHKAEIPYTIDRRTADLALRKYIVKVNDKTVNRTPTVDVTELKEGKSLTAKYNHAKNPVKVSVGDKILYEIRVYNEADINAEGTVIIDALPKGLEYIEESEINETYGWEQISEGENSTVYKTDYLKDHTIDAFDKEKDETLHSDYVQIECKIADNAKAASVLTNIAEIEEDLIDDRDSIPSNNDYTENDYDSSNYTGDNDNKKDLTDDNYYYKGREDDDDFEKVEVEGKTFDLSLKKFITRINNSAPNPSREPAVDVTNLKNGTSTDATYTTKKTPVLTERVI